MAYSPVIEDLLIKQLNQPLTAAEQAVVDEWLQASSQNQELYKSYLDKEQLEQKLADLQQFDEVAAWKKLLASGKWSPVKQQKNIPTLRKRNWYYAAAILILAIGSGIYIFNHQSYESQESHKSQFRQKAQAVIPPGTNKAILTLANGTQKELSPADNGLQLQSDALLLTTPKGGQYQAVLPDGSKVWLNAASSVKFPSKFTNKERRVEVTGEVYFEVAKDARNPFKVSGAGQEVEVLGTAFNINLYADEPNVKTTLIEGSIKVNNKILQPGQAYRNGKIIETNTEQDIAWKSGFFSFTGADVQEVMRQLSRWYDVTIGYEGKIPARKFEGKIQRGQSLGDVLEILEKNDIHFRMDGRKIIVHP